LEHHVKTKLLSTVVATALLGLSGTASAYMTFFDEDLNNSATVPLALTPYSSAKEAQFKAQLTGVSTETFESQATGAIAPLTLNFGGSLTATLTGGGKVASVSPGTTNGFGRYSIPSASSSKYWEVDARSFEINFSQAIAAFGFYGVDVGDFGGQVSIDFYNGTSLINSIDVPHTIVSTTSTDGSVLFFGAIASNAAEEFTSVRFRTTYGSGDVFAFDNFTIGARDQVIPPTNPTPIPGTLLLAGLGLAGLGAMRRRAR
jgi:MYXO-CTERM domain-containing protein